LELEKIDFSLHDVVKLVVQILKIKADEKNLQFTYQIQQDVHDVLLGDPHRLKQILINLCGNAIKFTEQGAVTLHVLAEVNHSITFRVSDTGIGIPADKLDSVFESFRQVQSSDTRKYGGTGLGLSISKQLIELQGGEIYVESILGKGTTFYFTIPFPEGSKEKLLQQSSEHEMDTGILQGLKVLLADDNEFNRMLATDSLLSETEMFIDTAENGKQVIHLLQKNDYDVILMDVQMPEMDGYETTKYIRSQIHNPDSAIHNPALPIIALTASALKKDIERCIAAGMNSFVPKPFKQWQLFSAIIEVTNRGRVGEKRKTPEQHTLVDSITDLSFLKEFAKGDEKQVKKYVEMYLQKTPENLQKIESAMQANDLDTIKITVHTMKAHFNFMGMQATGALAEEIELQIEENNTDSLSVKLNKLKNDCVMSFHELTIK
jgi:hypothetical protein